MQNLSPRHVKTEESLRLGVESGWYSTKVSGTLLARPGSQAGNGGSIETSGSTLSIGGATVDAGQGGQWLLDEVSG